MIAAKNIPGLLEMAVLQHLPFDAGARYAVATVSPLRDHLRGRAALLRRPWAWAGRRSNGSWPP